MISHVYIGITDFDLSLSFYSQLFGILDLQQKFVSKHEGWAAWHELEKPKPLIIIGKAHEGDASAGNGQMVAFNASKRSLVDTCYTKAIELGGTCEGKPNLRPQYHPHYYGAYFRDLDGNKLCVVCHDPEK